MQAYFDCLVNKGHLSKEESDTIEEIISTAESIYRTNTNDIYYELKAKYAAFVQNNKKQALSILDEGISVFKSSFYLHKDYFDICKKFDDIKGMELAYKNLCGLSGSNNPANKSALSTRKCYLDAYKGKSEISIKVELMEHTHFTENALNNIQNNIKRIISNKRTIS